MRPSLKTFNRLIIPYARKVVRGDFARNLNLALSNPNRVSKFMVNNLQTRDSLNLIATPVSPLVIRPQFARLTGQGCRPIGCVMTNAADEKPTTPKKVLSPAAKRALAEAAERRKARGGIAYDF